ncbi:MAG: hypothetical protein IJ417_04545 [Bacteroidaceae bacterium]|nr:hypothetical protein [Bacteroidaceae bacterium]
MADFVFDISCSDEIRKICPQYKGKALLASVVNTAYSEELWTEIATASERYCSDFTVDTIKEWKPIQATREAYKRCGKDPSRYRPSAESLCRRLLRGLSLYQVDTLVDLINLLSFTTGYSIGGFDADKIVGNKLVLGIGQAGEPYEGIGRGVLNIEGLPVYRDAVGGIGTPTSDHERTKLSVETHRLLVIINAYDGDENSLNEATERLRELLVRYAHAENISEYMIE